MTARTATVIGNKKGKLQFGQNVKEMKTLTVETDATVDAGDTVSIDYGYYGITTVLGVKGWKHTTDNSVVVTENPTTVVASSVMTITVPAGSDNDKRIYQLYYI